MGLKPSGFGVHFFTVTFTPAASEGCHERSESLVAQEVGHPWQLRQCRDAQKAPRHAVVRPGAVDADRHG